MCPGLAEGLKKVGASSPHHGCCENGSLRGAFVCLSIGLPSSSRYDLSKRITFLSTYTDIERLPNLHGYPDQFLFRNSDMILSAGAPNHSYVRLKRASPSLHLRPYSSDSSGIKNIILSFEIKLPFVTRPITQACHAKFIRQHIKSSATLSRSALERHVLLRLLEYWTQTPQSTSAARNCCIPDRCRRWALLFS
jgi:hypothetical protein